MLELSEKSMDSKVEMIEKRDLGNTGIQLSALGFGCASLWGKTVITDEEAQILFEGGYELGIRYFDTSYSYGIAEKRIGRILKNSEVVDKNEIVISTKFGVRRKGRKYIHDFSVEWMKHSVNTSLERLGLESLDCLMCHGPKIKDLTPEFLSELANLKKSGTVRSIGINTFDTEVIEYIIELDCFDFVMLDYNILRQEREETIEKLYRKGIGIIAGAPLAESLFSNRVFRIRSYKDLWYFARALVRFRNQLFKGREFAFINDVEGMSGQQIALKYVIDNQYVSSAVFGTTSIKHLEDNIQSKEILIPDEIRAKIKSKAKS